jgi:hypothetical protein
MISKALKRGQLGCDRSLQYQVKYMNHTPGQLLTLTPENSLASNLKSTTV